jgi:hypothetical protein
MNIKGKEFSVWGKGVGVEIIGCFLLNFKTDWYLRSVFLNPIVVLLEYHFNLNHLSNAIC